jgi:hypothetical protein
MMRKFFAVLLLLCPAFCFAANNAVGGTLSPVVVSCVKLKGERKTIFVNVKNNESELCVKGCVYRWTAKAVGKSVQRLDAVATGQSCAG